MNFCFLLYKKQRIIFEKNNEVVNIHPHAEQRAKERGAEIDEITE
jgi:hypothetical protein